MKEDNAGVAEGGRLVLLCVGGQMLLYVWRERLGLSSGLLRHIVSVCADTNYA